MKWIFSILLFVNLTAIGQSDDTNKYIWYQTQYGMRMARLWADSVMKAAGLVKFTGLSSRADTTTYKPLIIDASGNVSKMAGWPVPPSIDTTSLSNRINLKLNITDTTNKWINALRRRSGTDTVEMLKGGTWQAVYKDSTGGTMDSSVFATQFSARREQILDSIYEKSSWANLNDFVNNSSGGTVTSGNIVFTSGAGNFAKTLDLKVDNVSSDHYTMLNHWKISGRFKITGSSTGVGIGLNSYNTFFPHYTLAQFNTSNNNLVIWCDGGVVTTLSSAITYTTNDSIELTYERKGPTFIATVRNITTNSATKYLTTNLGFGGSSLPNTGRFSVFNIGSAFTLYKLKVTSEETKNAELCVNGDSKSAGYNATYAEYSFPYLLAKNYTTIIEAGPADVTANIIQQLPEIIALRPRQVLLCIGVNDIAFGISSGTWQANIATIVSTLTAAGIRVVLINSLYDITNAATLAAHINSAYPSSQVIDCYTAGNRAGTLAGDNVHPTDYGHQIAYETIINSHKLLYGNINRGRDSLFYNLKFTKNIYAAGATAPSSFSDGDIIFPYNVGLTAWAGATNRYGRILPFSNTGVVEFRNYYYGSAGDVSHAWYIPNGSTGTQQIGYSLTNVGDAFNLGNMRLATSLIPTGFSSAIGHLILPVDGMVGAATGSANQRGTYMPFSNQGVSEYRNYFFSSTSHKSHAWYTPNGSTNTQQASLYLTDDAKVHIPVKDSVSSPANMASINPSTGAIEIAAVPNNGTVATGGTGNTSFTTYALIAGGTTSTGALQQVSGLGTSGQALISNGSGALPTFQNISRTIDIQYTTASNSGTSETDLFTKTVAANTLTANGQTLNFTIDGEVNDNTATAQIKLYFAGNTTLNTGAINISTANTAWVIKGKIVRTSPTTAHVTYELDALGLATPKFIGYSNLTSLDFTTTNIFKVTAQAGGAGGGNGDITAHSWQVLYKPEQ